MGTLRQEAKAATRVKVLGAAKALFEADGYDAATIRAIAAAAGMSTGAVFAHFTGKAEVYRELYGHAPVSPALGRALLIAARDHLNGRGLGPLMAVVTMVEEA